LFVAEENRGQARGLALLAEGFRRQHNADIQIARAAIDHGNKEMLRLLKRHLGVHLQAIGSSRTFVESKGTDNASYLATSNAPNNRTIASPKKNDDCLEITPIHDNNQIATPFEMLNDHWGNSYFFDVAFNASTFM